MSGLFENLSGAKGLRAQGANQQRIEEFNAQVKEQEAKAALLRSGFDQERQAKEAERIKSRVQARIGAAGGTGSPVAVDITAEQASELELENLLIGFEGEVAAQQARTSADLSRLQGELAFKSGKAAARRANIGFATQLAGLGTTFLTGFGGGGGGGSAGFEGPPRP